MPGEAWQKSPDEWQALVVQLLKMRYRTGDFVEIPDKVNGDCGIEGFGRDGRAFQCYAAEEPCEVEVLTTRQKSKVTQDLQKLITNAAKLAPLLGLTRLTHWVLIVPRWEDKALISHAESKAAAVRQSGIPFVEPSFAPAIHTLEDFLEEHQKLVSTRRSTLKLVTAPVEDDEIDRWLATCNASWINNLDRKCRALTGNDARAKELKVEFIRHYLRGQNALTKLRRFPELYEIAVSIKRDKEQFLHASSLIPDSLPPGKLNDALSELKNSFGASLPGMDSHTATELTHEAVADWLIRCPLDFPDHA